LPVERQPVHARHPQVEQGHVVGPPPHQFQGLGPVVGGVHLITQVGEDVRQVAAGVHVVVDHQDPSPRGGHGAPFPRVSCAPRPPPDGPRGCIPWAWAAGGRGTAAWSSTVKVLPRPGSLATRRLPWFFSRIDRAMDRPSPRPRALVEYSGSVTRARCSGAIPTPVSGTATSSGPSPARRPVIDSRPPCGMASRALRTRLPKTMRSWSTSPRAGGRDGGQSTATWQLAGTGLASSTSWRNGPSGNGRRSGTGILAKLDRAVMTPSARDTCRSMLPHLSDF